MVQEVRRHTDEVWYEAFRSSGGWKDVFEIELGAGVGKYLVRLPERQEL